MIKHDFHIHTNLSICGGKSATVEGYINSAQTLGIKKIGFANHFWDERIPTISDWYRKQSFEHISKIKAELDQYRNCGIDMYFGGECEYDLANRSVAVSEEVAEQLDFLIIPNSHTHMVMPHELYEPYERHRDFMFDAYMDILKSPVSKYITAMAHPFDAVCCPYPKDLIFDLISDDSFKFAFDKTAERGIAVEINVHDFGDKTISELEAMPKMRMFRIAKECGCKFLFGSDAHAPAQQLQDFGSSETMIKLLALTENDIADIAK